jgi:nucleoid-associated protein YgaU
VAFEYLIEKVKIVGTKAERRTRDQVGSALSIVGGVVGQAIKSSGQPKVVAAVFMPPTSFIQKERIEATSIEWTIDDDDDAEPIIEHSGIRGEVFTVRGTSGYQARLGQDKDGKDLFDIGPELFKELDKFFAEYQRQTNKEEQETGKQQHWLVFHALDEEQDVRVEPQRWNWSRSVERDRFTYSWELALTRVGSASPRKLSELEELQKASKEISRAVNDISATVAQGAEYLEDINETLDSFREPLRSVLRLTDQLDSVVKQARRIIDWPSALFRDLHWIAGGAADVLYGAWDALGPAARDYARPSYIETMGQIASVRRLSTNVLGRAGVRTGTAPTSSTQTPRVTKLKQLQELGTVEAKVKKGDTLADLAGEILGDRSRWIEIAIINGWHSPVVMPDGKPIQPNTTVLVPAAAGEGSKGGPQADRYGTDWRLVDGDMVPAGDDPTDFQVVTGPANFSQGLTVRLKSIQGVTPPFPELGLPELVGRRNTLTRLALATSHVRQQLLLDPRVDSIASLQLVDGGDSYTIKAEVVATDGRDLLLVVPVE